MSTPLYSFLKGYSKDNIYGNINNLSTFVFPSSKTMISNSQLNDNYKMNFTKFALLDLDLSKMSLDDKNVFNTESPNTIQNKSELLVASLRNYVANHDVVIRDSLLNSTEYFYDPNILRTPTERIFWKWLRKSGLIDFEVATPNDEYTETVDLSVDNNLDEDYFKKYLWKERSTIEYNITSIVDENITLLDPYDSIVKKVYKITTSSNTNFKPNDRIILTNKSNINIGFLDTKEVTVYDIKSSSVDIKNDIVYVYSNTALIWNNASVATAKLNYERVVKYIGEISNYNNVQTAEKSYYEILAYIADNATQTPDILFDIVSDNNYSPSLQYPILSIQDQPEIVGGEQSDSPLILNPENYSGDQFAYFDIDNKYVNSSGLQDRKIGDYYGVMVDNRNDTRVVSAPYVYPEFDGSKLDGICIDFNTTHYTKMNIPTKLSKNFDEFNTKVFENSYVDKFSFNCILWYSSVQDNTYMSESVLSSEDRQATNLYAITFLNGVDQTGKIPSYNKLVANNQQDGLSYVFSLNSNINISDEQVKEEYDPEKSYSLYSFSNYNEVVAKLTYTIDLFNNINNNNILLQQDINNVKNLLYTQTDINTINNKINDLYKLLNYYKNLQIKNSDSVTVNIDNTTNPPLLSLNANSNRYGYIEEFLTTSLYDTQNNRAIDKTINIPTKSDFMINIINNDLEEKTLDKNLNIILDKDLDYKQVCEINIYPSNCTENKKLNILINSSFEQNHVLIDNIDLPIDNNTNKNEIIEPISKRWNNFPYLYPNNIHIKKISNTYYLLLDINSNLVNGFKIGDYLMINNLKISYNYNDSNNIIDISGQYRIYNIENNQIVFKITNSVMSELFKALEIQNNTNSNTQNLISSNYTQPVFISVNKGYKITIVSKDRISNSIDEKYLIEITELNLKK